jgi:nucleotide-binding universal stress UspA family protein
MANNHVEVCSTGCEWLLERAIGLPPLYVPHSCPVLQYPEADLLLSVFQNRVSFDTFDKPADFIEESSFTLIAKHKDYEYTKRSRTFLCGFDENEYSVYALQWLINELVDDGDEIVCLRVVEKEDAIANDRSVETGRYRVEAEATMADIQSRNHDNKAINLILEFSIGKVNKVIDDMVSLVGQGQLITADDAQINLYEPAILVVGTRGKSLGGFQGLLPGSVSKYCLQHSPVPVIVVRPTSKRDKAKSKRTNDPDRQGYREILAPKPANVHKPSVDTHPLAQVEHAESSDDDDVDTGTSTLVGDDPRSPLPLMKSPHLQNLDSPELSSQSSSEDEDEQGGVSTNTGVSDVGRGMEKLNVGGDAGARQSSMSYVDSLLNASNASSTAVSPKSEARDPMQKSAEGP